ncbi:MAG: hypothetical protein ACXWOL_04395, partial [Ktedonobacteraceae bacterium]
MAYKIRNGVDALFSTGLFEQELNVFPDSLRRMEVLIDAYFSSYASKEKEFSKIIMKTMEDAVNSQYRVVDKLRYAKIGYDDELGQAKFQAKEEYSNSYTKFMETLQELAK